MLSLELSDYKKGMETLRKKCESADKELLEKDGMLKELGIKLHNLTERNVQLTDTVSEQRYEMDTQNAKIKGTLFII
jgi:predicted  nucleic acid-binding Zn-ribbon protein